MDKFDIKNQTFPGQETPAEDYSNELPDCIQNIKEFSPWFQRDFNLSISKKDRKKIRKYLDSLTDDEIIPLYSQMMEEKKVWDGGYFYHNIQVLFGTPFAKEKDGREIGVYSVQIIPYLILKKPLKDGKGF